MNANQYFFAALIFDYLDFLKNIKGLSENTAKAYQRDLNKFSKFLYPCLLPTNNTQSLNFFEFNLGEVTPSKLEAR